MVKVAHKYAEQARIAVRHVRRDGMDRLKKAGERRPHSTDDTRTQSDELQKLTDATIKEIDDMLATKEREITQV
jgi:ribosome recycling factor